MNFIQLVADLVHLFAIVFILYVVHKTESCAGFSVKTQTLYGIVFITRYLDVFWTEFNLYLFVYKIVFISATLYTVYLMLYRYKHTMDAEFDMLRLEYFIAPAFVFALIANDQFSLGEILFRFSLYLETLTILPQFYLCLKMNTVDKYMGGYMLALGVYKTLYVFNWVYKFEEYGAYDGKKAIAGVLQTMIYWTFFGYLLYCYGEYVLNEPLGQRVDQPVKLGDDEV